MKRRVYTLLVLVFWAVVCAAMMTSGCRHTNFGPLDPIKVPGTWERRVGTRVLEVSAGSVAVHSINIEFSASMSKGTVTGITVRDAAGNDVPLGRSVWSADVRTLTLRGPFAFCSYYYVNVPAGIMDQAELTLKEAVTIEVLTTNNPMNFDDDEGCTADAALSRLFTSGPDAAVLTGDFIVRSMSRTEFTRQEIDTDETFYVNEKERYPSADNILLIPSASGDGSASVAMLFYKDVLQQGVKRTDYALNVWSRFDPEDEMPTTSLIHSIAWSLGKDLYGPFEAGDINGDGRPELMVSNELHWSAGAELQELLLMRMPLPEGELPLEDAAEFSTVLGDDREVVGPFKYVGDLNGDRMDDLAAVRHILRTDGKRTDWQVWVIKGDEPVHKAFADPVEIYRAFSDHIITDVEGSDVNGDGKADLLITEVQEKWALGAFRYVEPRIRVFFGSRGAHDPTDYYGDVELVLRSERETADTEVKVRSIGDVNGDGIEDLAIFMEERDLNRRKISSKVFVFGGKNREAWGERFFVNGFSPQSRAVIDALAYGDVIFKDGSYDVRTGDIDNDGYYDLVIVTESGLERTAHWFYGGEDLSNASRTKRWTLGNADGAWTFVRW